MTVVPARLADSDGTRSRGEVREAEPSGLEQHWPAWVRVSFWGVIVLAVAAATAFSPVVGVAVALAVAGGLLLLHRPIVAALLVVSAAPALSGLARGVPVPAIRLSEVLLGGTAVLVLLLTRIDEPPWRPVDWALLLYALATFGLGLVGALRHDIPLDGEALSDMVLPFQFVLGLRVATTALRRPGDRERALRWVLWAGAAVAALSIVQYVSPPLQDVMAVLTASDNFAYNDLYFVARATGPFPIWHFLGGYLLLVALLAIALLVHGNTAVLGRPGLIVVVMLASVGIVLTLTLAVLFGLVLGYVVLALWSARGRLWLGRGAVVGLAGAIAASPLVGGRLDDQRTRGDDSLVPQTLSFRWDVWINQYFPSMDGRWVLGYGPGIPEEIYWRFTESVYITYLLQGGLVLVLGFLALQGILLKTMLDARCTTDTTRTAVASAVAAMVVVLVPLHAIFPYMTGLGLPQLLWALAGVALAGLHGTSGRAGSDEPVPLR